MNIVIIGLGLIGGSIAKSLSVIDKVKIKAFDMNKDSINNALENGSIHGAIHSLEELKNKEFNNSIIIIATPPSAVVNVLKSISFLFNSTATITDTTSTKSLLDQCLKEFDFPNNVIFSHPVAGSHLSGEINSIIDLFHGKSVILSHHHSVSQLHFDKVTDLWNKLGSKVTVIDVKIHDEIFAYTSHLPHAVSYALLRTLRELDQKNLSVFSGGGLGEFLRLASSSTQMWADVFSINKKNVVMAIDDLIENLNLLKNDIENNPKDLQLLLEELKIFKEENY